MKRRSKSLRSFVPLSFLTVLVACVNDEQRMAANAIAGNLSGAVAGVSSKILMPATFLGSSEQRSFRVHGHYCGKGFPSSNEFFSKIRMTSQRPEGIYFSIKSDLHPIDAVDQACAKHDICYAFSDTDPRWRKSDCDVVLMCELYAIKTDRNPELITPRAKVISWAGGAAWYNLSSDCNHLMRGARPMIFARD